MTISSFQEFYNTLKEAPITVISELSGCINLLNRICTCKKAQRDSKNEECNNIYINIVKDNSESLIEHLKPLTQDNEVIFRHSTHYDIITLKIR